MMMHVAVSVVLPARYVIWRKMMSEPQYLEGDDAALKDECEYCGNFIHTCECAEPDPDYAHDTRFDD
jgi:hypothetical protein